MHIYPNIELFNPKECLSGKISRIHRLTATIFRKHMAPYGVSNSQVSLLFVLSKMENLTQKELSDLAKLEKSSLHRNLKRLIEQGHLDKKNFPQIEITEKGKKLVDSIIPEWEKAMAEIREVIGEEGESSINRIHQKLASK